MKPWHEFKPRRYVVCMHACVYVFTYVGVCVSNVLLHAYAYTLMYVSSCAYARTHVCWQWQMRMDIHISVFVIFAYVCVYVCVTLHTYISAQTLALERGQGRRRGEGAGDETNPARSHQKIKSLEGKLEFLADKISGSRGSHRPSPPPLSPTFSPPTCLPFPAAASLILRSFVDI